MKLLKPFKACFLLTLLVMCASCGQDQTHESDNLANFERIFAKSPPASVDVVNSVLLEYRIRIGVVTTDDWEIEILAPRSWIDQQIEGMRLGPIREESWVAKNVGDRKGSPYRPWYAPRPLDSYDVFYLMPTSIPYVHMLVEKQPQPDGRYRLFMSKH